MDHLETDKAPGDIVLSRTLALMTRDLAHPVSIRRAAASLHYSVRTLELKARRVFGCTLKEKTTRIRLDEAVRLLSTTSLRVRDVARKCGFCDATHLGKCLRAAFGRSPSQFRLTPENSK